MTTIIRRNIPSVNEADFGAYPPILKRIYAGRNIQSKKSLDYSLIQLLPTQLLSGIDLATQLLANAIQQQQKLLIVADFDVDGATSCTLAVRALKKLGAKYVDYIVPNRFEYGYGLTPEIVDLLSVKQPDVIITVDNGISSIDGVKAAKDKGYQVVVTDHHLPGEQLPDADAIINPNLPDDNFPSKCIAGVGVIFYVMLALRTTLRELNWFSKMGIEQPNMAHFLDLVALGTVADVVSLDHNNRIMVEQGIRRIRADACGEGIKALIQIAGKNQADLTTSDLGFALAPRLNAAGRLEDMSQGIECLLTDQSQKAIQLARQLDRLNKERKSIESDMKYQAYEIMSTLSEQQQQDQFGICLYNSEWHQGVIGILASRIKEKHHRPVFIFAPQDETMLKGSGRSIAAIHLKDILDQITREHPALIEKFGGHAMAAGMTIKQENYPQFSTLFNAAVEQQIDQAHLRNVVETDGELQPDEITINIAELLRKAGPWGQGFPEPLFDGCFNITEHKVVGEKHLKMTLQHPDHALQINAIAFNVSEQLDHVNNGLANFVYRLDINEYKGYKNPQLIIEHFEMC